ncbi:hypothetical protein LEP1GSC124_1717 [Leptospira interrogans serovar Pyrogenes str. 200701872]|uniref:Uncharacterized protein n=1 Tax=Leptospira interrogans serovar Pyrogenes str. 200701872 TaxID=1193029 RepID=M7A426_LEPIR|nr:hypothetical protein LEP1GSC124_1717 [Leptospira interrogans serovar Pyrogenes str. 200701872]
MIRNTVILSNFSFLYPIRKLYVRFGWRFQKGKRKDVTKTFSTF